MALIKLASLQEEVGEHPVRRSQRLRVVSQQLSVVVIKVFLKVSSKVIRCLDLGGGDGGVKEVSEQVKPEEQVAFLLMFAMVEKC